MKAIKRNFENLKKVSDSIISIPFITGSFSVDYELPESNSIRLVSENRDSIGSSILDLIPSNYLFRVSFVDNSLFLVIWFH